MGVRGKPMKYFEETKQRKCIYQGVVFDVYEDEVLLHQNNQLTTRELIDHPGGVCVAAQRSDGKFILVSQYRYAQQAIGLEFIAGKKEKDEDPFKAIQRELQEEGGVMAQTWHELGEAFPSPAYLNEKIHLYYAKDLTTVGQHLDEEEFIQLYYLSLDEIIQMIEQNEIKDMKTILLAYKLKSMIQAQ